MSELSPNGGAWDNKTSSTLFFVALGVGLLFAGIFIFMGLRYCYRRRRNPQFYEQQELAFRQHYRANIRASRKKKPKLMTQEQVDSLFPVMTYKEALLLLPTKTSPPDKEQSFAHDDTEDTVTVNGYSGDTFEKSPAAESQPIGDDEDKEGQLVVQEQPDNVCAICIEEMEDQQQVRLLTCGHIFHTECVDPWLTTRRAYCPLCKYDYYVPPPPEEEENNGEVFIAEPQIPPPVVPRRVLFARFIGMGRRNSSRDEPASVEHSPRPAHLEVMT